MKFWQRPSLILSIKSNKKRTNIGDGAMIKAPPEFLEDLRVVFKKYNIHLDVYPEYDGEERFCGDRVETKSRTFDHGSLQIFINSMRELAEAL